ncbi:hypothetical protein MIR68_004686 [Amoeboaphelidium protococcarum]|nr:hypothetical protein MIR68_007599 [Amoeboaphelidium protococcarum]KAI3637268.1 hypothetical protein MIR68_004686 [Amoeboaphelidium protococcarum]KAI3642615.1 hypothetical protein MP228_012170 [Amoeboaphelidium protococcarum]KAI3645539.1 hypothetical protein MP228_008467 [Amoeboaphelidium protococcarum]
MTDNVTFGTFDPFANEKLESQEDATASSTSIIHLRIQQRNGRKTLTTITGLPSDLDQKKLLKAFKKVFACNGTIIEDEELGEVIQLQGDHRAKVQQFLVEEKIATKDQIKVHGF